LAACYHMISALRKGVSLRVNQGVCADAVAGAGGAMVTYCT
jgi:hypothetical protein